MKILAILGRTILASTPTYLLQHNCSITSYMFFKVDSGWLSMFYHSSAGKKIILKVSKWL